jgi:hypothetical protein
MTTSALEKFIEKIDGMKLNKTAEEYYKVGSDYVAKNQYDDAIIEFTKVVRISSTLKNKSYLSAQAELISMGFSEDDVKQVRLPHAARRALALHISDPAQKGANSYNKNISISQLRHPRWVIAWMLILLVIALALSVIWIAVVILTMMVSDAPITLEIIVAGWVFYLYPLLPIAAAIVSMNFFARRKYRTALIITSLFLLLAVPLIGYFVIYGFSAL